MEARDEKICIAWSSHELMAGLVRAFQLERQLDPGPIKHDILVLDPGIELDDFINLLHLHEREFPY